MVRRGDPGLAIAYLRVSTDGQGLGLEAQRALVEGWAKREGVSVIAWEVDQGVSGAADIADRPALVAALAALRTQRAGLLVVAKRDRLARDPYVALGIERAAAAAGAGVVAADGVGNGDDAAAAFMRTVIDGAAAYERALIRARTRAALAAKKAKGERTGGVPFGWALAADGVRLVELAQEQEVIRAAGALRSAGLSLRAIARELALQGFRPRRGAAFGPEQVRRMAAAAGTQAERVAA